MTIVFHPLAEQELIDSVTFYEARAAGLGVDFIRQVERALVQIVANPNASKLVGGTIRRRLIQRFPFAVLYESVADNISVIAIMHLRRRPGYWRRRRLKPKPAFPRR